MKAIWSGTIIAESNDTVEIEGNHYFPADSVKKEYLKPSDTETLCHWKGKASYHHLEVDGKINHDAAWYYEHPKKPAHVIKDRVTFWKGVEIIK
jgi:uncharacterized protein (DUF427 family)